jgi:hypothetical protein
MKFIPYGGNASVDAAFNDEEEARKTYQAALECNDERINITDSFGIDVCFHPSKGCLLLTNTMASAEFSKTLDERNAEARDSKGVFEKVRNIRGFPSDIQ